MLELMQKGGPFMVPLAMASLAAFALMIDRFFQLYLKYSIDFRKLVDSVLERLERLDFRGALAETDSAGSHPLAETVRAGLLKADRSDREIQRSMEQALTRHLPRVTKRTNYLAMLANVATLLGLLGTIQGLIQCFAHVADASAAEKQVVLAKGISIAMFTTFSGLIVAIPCLIAYTVFHNKEMAVVNEVEDGAMTVFNRIAETNRDIARSGEAPRPAPARRANGKRV